MTALALAGATLAVEPLSAATKTWVGNTSNLWSVGANWSDGLPANGDTIVFGAPGSSGVALSNDVLARTLGGIDTDGIVFGSAASAYTITRSGSSALTLASSGSGVAIKDLSLFAQTAPAGIIFSGDQTIQVGATTGAAMSTLTTAGITGGARLTKTGVGTLMLNSNSVLSGVTILGGTVSIGADGQLSSPAPSSATPGWLVLNGGTLRTSHTGNLIINANRGITLGASGGTILVNKSNPATDTVTIYNGIIDGTAVGNSLTKTGNGTLSLGGANTYTGATQVVQGQLLLDFAQTGLASNIINSSSRLILGGVPTGPVGTSLAAAPTLFVQGLVTGVDTSQSFNGLTLNLGNSSIIAKTVSSTLSTTVALGAITHNPGGTVGFSLLANTSASDQGQGIITTTTANTNGILGAWATTGAVGTGTTAVTQTDWAAVDGTGKIVAYTDYTTLSGAAPTMVSAAASNVRISNASTGNIALAAGITDVNTILMNDTSAVSRQLTVAAGNTLRLGSNGGVWRTAAVANGLTIGGNTVAASGTLTAGGAPDTAGEIVFNTNGSTATTVAINVNASIANNGTGVVSVTKTGTSALTLAGTNTYTGGTFINQGNVNATSLGAFGTGDVRVAGGAAILTAVGTYANNFYISSNGLALGNLGSNVGGTVTLLSDAQIFGGASSIGGTISGKITGDYNLGLYGGVITFSNSANDYGGNLSINGYGAQAFTLKLGANEVLANGAGKGNVTITATGNSNNNTNNTTLDLNGMTETINGLTSAIASGAFTTQAIITNNATGTASTLTIGDNDQTTSYIGLIKDGAGTVAITKIGAGTQTFTGANTYTGKTTVAAGTLLLSSSTVDSTIAGSTVIDVRSGATLNVAGVTTITATTTGFVVGSTQTLIGNGTVVGNTTVVGNLAPGASPGALTFANDLTLTSTAVTTMEIIGTSRGVAGGYDAINLGSTSVLTYDGNLILTMSGIIAGGTYDLFNFTLAAKGAFDAVAFGGGFYTGAWTSAGAGVWTASSNGQDFSFSEVTGDLNVTAAIPEPATWALLGMGLGAVVLIRRRRPIAA